LILRAATATTGRFAWRFMKVLFSIGVNPRSSAADIPGIGFGLAGVNPRSLTVAVR
jgi:hypothetical protein